MPRESYIPTLANTKPPLTEMPGITQFTEGDLHGNLIRRLESCLHFGAIDIDADYYRILVDAYESLLTKYDKEINDPDTLNNLENIIIDLIGHIKIKNPQLLARSMEDYFADRTGNMRLTAHLEEKLQQLNVRTTRMASNHDINVYIDTLNANNFQEFKEQVAANAFYETKKQGISTLRFIASLERMPLSQQEQEFARWKRVAEQSLLQTKLIDYSIGSNGNLYIYTHGVPNYELFNALAKQFNVGNNFDFNRANQEQKIQVINQINHHFNICMQTRNGKLLQSIFIPGTAAYDLIWRRETEEAAHGKTIKSSFIPPRTKADPHYTYSCYGHDNSLDRHPDLGPPPENLIRLDNNCGKGSLTASHETTGFGNDHTSNYPVLKSSESPEKIINAIYQNCFDYNKRKSYKLFRQ